MKSNNTLTTAELQQLTTATLDRLTKLRAGLATVEAQGPAHGEEALGLTHTVDRFQALAAKCQHAVTREAVGFDAMLFNLDDLERASEAVAPLHRQNMRRQDRSLSALVTKLTVMTAWPAVHDEH